MAERTSKGQFKKGVRSHPSTEFKKGQHWRPEKPYWNYDWLNTEYTTNLRSAADIAAEFGINEVSIQYWLRKLNIPRRDMKTIRKNKKWGLNGKQNGMFGRKGKDSPRWKGGCSPERQTFYSSFEWARIVPVIYRRDLFECQRCGAEHTGKNPLHIHHIVSFSVKRLRCDPTNLILLCKNCHNFVHSKKNKEGEFIGHL